jgi:hypothetical protein
MAFSPSVFGGSVMLRRRPLMGMTRRHSRRHRGKGIFGDIWNGVKSAASSLAPHVLPVIRDLGVSLIKKKLGVGRRRHRLSRRSRTGRARSVMGLLRSLSRGHGSHRRSHRRRSRMGCARSVFSATRGMRRRRHRSRLGRARMIMGARRSHRRRSHMGMRRRHRRRIGRGLVGNLLGSLLPF